MVTQHPHQNASADVLRVAMVVEQPRVMVIEAVLALDLPNGLLLRGFLFGVSRRLLGTLSVVRLLLLGLALLPLGPPFGANCIFADAALVRFLANAVVI